MTEARQSVEPEPHYEPAEGERQFTARALIAGSIVGGLICMINVSFGLKTGWAIGGSILAAVLSYAMMSVGQRVFRSAPLTALETNIAQTAGSAAGAVTSAAGLNNAIPAMALLGFEYSGLQLLLWAASVGTLGVFYAVPLRRQMVLIDKLRFPSGTATAATIVAIFGKGEDANKQTKMFLAMALAGAAFFLTAHWFPAAGSPPIHDWWELPFLITAASYGFTLLLSPLFTGAGILVGPRISTSLLAGAILGWGVLAPYAQSQGWANDALMDASHGPRAWILWPGVAMMTAEGLTALALNWRSVVRAFVGSGAENGDVDRAPMSEQITNVTWIGGLALATVATTFTAWLLFDMNPLLTPFAVALTAVLAAVATRTLGETEINPVGPMGKITQIAYGGIAPGHIPTNLMGAAVTAAGASQAADMMQDLKTGHLLGASPKKQFKAQLVGIVVGILVCIPIYSVTTSQHELGGAELPAPAAQAWKAVAELLTKGFDALPPFAEPAAAAGLLFGILLPIARKYLPENRSRYLPSALAMGIGFLVPAFFSIAFFLGAMVDLVWSKVQPKREAGIAFVVAAGLMAGEGLTEAAINTANFFGLDI